MPHLRSGGRRRGGRPRRGEKNQTLPVSMRGEVEDAKEVSPGKYEVEKQSISPALEVIPPNMSPVEYLEKKQLAIIGRIEGLATNGKPEDAVKLKANAILLNKVLPDILKSEVKITVSPYERILKAIEEGEDE